MLSGMTISRDATIRPLPGAEPHIDDDVFVAEGARILGAVTLESRSSVWCNAVLRADVAPITVGRGSNVQDNVSVHVDASHPTVIGEGVSIGDNAVVHGCEIGDGSLIGMNATVLSGARIGELSDRRLAPSSSRAPSFRRVRWWQECPRRCVAS